MVIVGNVVQEFSIGKTRVRICDDFCSGKTKDDVETILRRIAKNALGPLSNGTSKSK